MIFSFKNNIPKQNVNFLATKMVTALLIGLATGLLLILLRENLIAHNHKHIWDFVNNLLFQDITTDEGRNAIGIFYIIGQLFINCLQLIIVPMIFSSISLSMCHISDTKKLGRISRKTLCGLLTTSIFALIIAIICGFIAYNLGVFNVSINGSTTNNISNISNPLMILIDIIPSNITAIFSSNGRVLSVVF